MELAWEEVVENDAWTTSKGWRPCPVSSSDPARFTTSDYTKFRHPKDIPLPASDSYHQWVWCGDWNYTKWKYCKKWDRNVNNWSFKQGKSARCRRRIWKRPRVRNNDETAQQSIREVVYENQRYLVKRWASPYLPKDRPHWSDVNGTFKTQGSVNNKLPLNWKWIDSEWQIEIIENETDSEGWQYAPDFDAVNWAPKRTILHHVRRRKFTRTRMRSNKQKAMQTRSIRTVSDTAKLKSHLKSKDNINGGDFDGTLVVSYTNQFELRWSTHGVIESSGYQCSIWSPKLGVNEYCLGYLLSAEKAYPTNQFLVIIKKNGSDPDAFRRPTGLTLIWSTRFNDPTASMHGHFYKPVAPPGYVALGDVVISRKKGIAVTVNDFPKLVCIKKEFVDQYAEFNSHTTDKYSKNVKSLIQPHTMIWNTKKLSNANVHCQLWTQPPFSNEVESAVFVCNKLTKPSNVYPRLNIKYVLQDDPDNITVHAQYATKKGKGVGSQARKRFFILTSDKKLEYFETDECRVSKGMVDLRTMTDKARVQQSNTEKFEIPTQGRKWVFTCNSSQNSIQWVNQINRVKQNPKAVVMKIIAAQIQGQPMEDDDYKINDDEKQDKTRQLFDAPLHEQVIRLLARNLNIIRKILKGDIEYIKKSVADETITKSQTMQPVMKKKKRSFKRTLSTENILNSSLTSTSDDIMRSHNENKQSIYKYFDDAWNAVRLLLKYFEGDVDDEQKDNRNSTEIMKKSTVQQVMNQIPNLREQTIQYIMRNITAYVKEYGNSSDPFEIIKMCDACAVVESFPTGRQTVVEHITNNLLKDIKNKYAPLTEFAGCEYIKQRFEDYNKQARYYDEVYSFFIPAKWIVPVTFSLQFCKLSGDQIDEHLKKNPEKTQMVMKGKHICIENEKKLQKEARTFLCQPHTELDKDEIEHTLPNYIGMISTILDQHLNSYISAERTKAEECVLSAKNETFNVLSEDGSLTEMYESGATKNATQKHKSCELLLVAIRVGFKKCIQISRGEQLVNLLLAHQQYLGQYHDILTDLIREALETNGVINIKPIECSDGKYKLTERYLWFEGYREHGIDGEEKKRRDRNSEDIVIQQVLTFLVLVYNTSLYCKESMSNLGKASHKAIESIELKDQVDFKPLYSQFELLQFKISERLSQLIVCRIVEDMHSTYKLMDFKNMNERDYIKLEKCRYLVESEWSNLAIQLLYIMPIAHYKLMIKRCVYLLAEFLFESTLKLKDINNKIAKLLMDNYTHIKQAILTHLANESQHLASEIETASEIIFAPVDILYDLLCTTNEPIPALDYEQNVLNDSNNTLFDTFKEKFRTNSDSFSEEKEPIFYKKYSQFEMKIVNFYHTSNIVLCFQTLLLQLAESQIKVNRSAKTIVKPIFFEAFNFNNYTKPQLDKKIELKKQLIHLIMKCKSINTEIQNKIESLYTNKKIIDMEQEQQHSISEAIKKKEEWEMEQKEKRLKAQQEREEMEAMEKLDIIKDKAITQFKNFIDNKNENVNEMDEDDDDDVIVMTQTVDVKDVENTIVKPEPEFKLQPKEEKVETAIMIVDNDESILDVETEKNFGGIIPIQKSKPQQTTKAKPITLPKPKKPTIAPPKVPNMAPPPVPRGKSPSPAVPNMAPPPIPRGASPSPALSNSSIGMGNKPRVPRSRPPPKPRSKLNGVNNKEEQGGLFDNFSKWIK